MINTINPEYTRQVFQTKYGTPNTFVYKPVVPVQLNWSVADYETNPDYTFINDQNSYSMFAGVLTMIVDVGVVGTLIFDMFSPLTTVFTQKIDVVTASLTNIAGFVAPFQIPVCFNYMGFDLKSIPTGKVAFNFMGFYYEQP